MKKLLGLLLGIMIVSGIAAADDLSNVFLTYCDTTGSTMQYTINPGTPKDICYMLTNKTQNEVTIRLSFVDGTFTNDERKNPACLSDADTVKFGQYVTKYDQFVTLQADETITKNAQLLYPTGTEGGLYHGCVVYSIVPKDAATQNPGSFAILMRRSKFIDAVIDSQKNNINNGTNVVDTSTETGINLVNFTKEDGPNISYNPQIRIYKDVADGKYMLQVKIKNLSNTDQDLIITGVTSSMVTSYKNTFVEERKVLGGETLLITQKLEDATPKYTMKVQLAISNTPLDVNNQKGVPGYLTEGTTIIIWDVITYSTIIGIIILLLIIFLLIKDLRKKKNIVLPPTTPIPTNTPVQTTP